MDFTIIDKARDWDELKQAYCGQRIWLIIQKPDQTLGFCIEESFLEFKKNFLDGNPNQIKVVQYFEDDAFYYGPEDRSNSFIMRGI